jgi:predicted alpha/beta superfamily hydrolase
MRTTSPLLCGLFILLSACSTGPRQETDGQATAGVTAESATARHPAVTVARSEVFTLHSKEIGDTFQLKVRLPPSYGTDSSKKYPVLYAPDGDIAFELTTGVIDYMQLAVVLGVPMDEYIVVGIGYGSNDTLDVANRRARDLTPTVVNPPPYPWETVTGGAGAFLSFLNAVVIPTVERRYAARAAGRAYYGHSYGGLFGAYALFTSPATFDRFILSSPTLSWDNGVIFAIEQQFSKNHSRLDKSVFLSVGSLEDESDRAPLPRMQTALAKYTALRVEALTLDGEDHLSILGAALSKGFRYVTQP